jgi:SAM-dependent methyltransferase
MLRKIKSKLKYLLDSPSSSEGVILKKIKSALADRDVAGKPILCNLGCGSRFSNEWLNFDFVSHSKHVFPWNLQRGIPLPDGSCDFVYSSHVIEHFTRNDANFFLGECFRVLRNGGIIRIATPDLERLAEHYLDCLKQVRYGASGAKDRYNWIIIELLDQLVRHHSGGEMLKYWTLDDIPEESFVIDRVGTEYKRARQTLKGRSLPPPLLDTNSVGTFRLSGEVHQWLYDNYSLSELLKESGFTEVQQFAADNSYLSDFASFSLETEPDGSVYKPDSFFIEGKASK